MNQPNAWKRWSHKETWSYWCDDWLGGIKRKCLWKYCEIQQDSGNSVGMCVWNWCHNSTLCKAWVAANRNTMQLHKCLLLAVSRPIVDVPGAKLSFDLDVWDSFQSCVLITPDRDSQRHAQGPIISMLQCIVTEWGLNAQTNFYIPPEHYSGYSYLFQDSEHSAWHSIKSRFSFPIQSNTLKYSWASSYFCPCGGVQITLFPPWCS